MTEFSCQQRFESPDGQSAVTIEDGDHGLSRFTIWHWIVARGDNSDFDHAYWAPSRYSGLFATSAEAMEAARAELDWLTD
jgi:hypothetical protein